LGEATAGEYRRLVGTAYWLLVLGHLLCVVGGFGALAYNGLFLSLARRRGAAGAAALEVNQQVSGMAEMLVYGAFLFGIAAVAASSSHWSFSQAWVSTAFGLFLVDVGILHGLIKRSQREYQALSTRLAAVPAGGVGGEAGPADVERLDALERRVSVGWGLFNLIVVAVVYLMVFKPGS
jgi:hypothetical protein